MKYTVLLDEKKIKKVLRNVPLKARITLRQLIDDISLTGPVQAKYKNYSKWNITATLIITG